MLGIATNSPVVAGAIQGLAGWSTVALVGCRPLLGWVCRWHDQEARPFSRRRHHHRLWDRSSDGTFDPHLTTQCGAGPTMMRDGAGANDCSRLLGRHLPSFRLPTFPASQASSSQTEKTFLPFFFCFFPNATPSLPPNSTANQQETASQALTNFTYPTCIPTAFLTRWRLPTSSTTTFRSPGSKLLLELCLRLWDYEANNLNRRFELFLLQDGEKKITEKVFTGELYYSRVFLFFVERH